MVRIHILATLSATFLLVSILHSTAAAQIEIIQRGDYQGTPGPHGSNGNGGKGFLGGIGKYSADELLIVNGGTFEGGDGGDGGFGSFGFFGGGKGGDGGDGGYGLDFAGINCEINGGKFTGGDGGVGGDGVGLIDIGQGGNGGDGGVGLVFSGSGKLMINEGQFYAGYGGSGGLGDPRGRLGGPGGGTRGQAGGVNPSVGLLVTNNAAAYISGYNISFTNGIASGNYSDGTPFSFTYATANGGQILAAPPSTVPEPSSIALLVGVGVSGAGMWARRRQSRRQ